MRRNRMRSFTIYGENEEEYIKEYEKTKSRLSQMIFNKNEIKESLQEDEEDDLGFQKSNLFILIIWMKKMIQIWELLIMTMMKI